MQTAYLYIRVSTDEQAIRGYSQRSQEERLTKFCITNNIEVLNSIFEDHSAKTFDRPAWSAMMSFIKRNKSVRPDLILFTKWDRFSRNAGDAYYMITQLRNLGIQPQAIDQELNLSIPENKIILAVYLATSEAENDRRSLNVKQGIHRAKQEGRWTAHVPLGYKYHLTANGRKNICPKEPEARFIHKAFVLIAENLQTTRSVYDHIVSSGLKCCISHFWRILRNPVYCGKVIVPAFETEKAYVVNGRHQPLIEEALFYKVQEVLDNKKRKPALSHSNDEQLFLRGFFYCPSCHKRLTGSASKGRGGRYYYYHCTSGCGFRIRADRANLMVQQKLSELQVEEVYLDLYRTVLKQSRNDLFSEKSITQKTVAQTIDRLIERIIKVKDLLIKDEIESDDYYLIKSDCEKKNRPVRCRITAIGHLGKKQNTNIEYLCP